MSSSNDAKGPARIDSRSRPPMGMTEAEFAVAADTVVKDITNYYATIQDRPVLPQIKPGYLRELIPAEPSEEAESWEAIRADIESKIMPGITHWQSPNYMAFFPANSTYPSILADMWSDALTAANFNWICSPAVTELETIVMDWVGKALNLPDVYLSKGRGGGVIQGSASEAAVTAMIAAREKYIRKLIEKETFANDEAREDRLYELRSKMIALGSDQTHSGTQKATMIVGCRWKAVKTQASDDFSLRASAVRTALEECKARGLHPFSLTVTIGTTNTCAVDDLAQLATLKADYPDLWIHVDAAYAGAALVLPEYHHLTTHFPSFDSFDVNLHKWLLVNFDCSAFYVQDRQDLTAALSINPSYLKNNYTDSGLVLDYRDWQIPLGRRFRALKVWFTMRTFGLAGMREHIRHHIRLGELFADLLRSRSDLFSILTGPSFALTVFTVRADAGQRKIEPTSGADARPYEESHVPVVTEGETQQSELVRANEITREVYQLIDGEGEIFLTASVIGAVQAIRVVSANPLAEEKFVRRAFDIIVDATERVLAKRRAAKA